MLTSVDPFYPPHAQRNHVAGWVDVAASIGPDGEVVDPRVIASSPSGTFEEAALSAYRQWRFCPPSDVVQYPEGVRTRMQFALGPLPPSKPRLASAFAVLTGTWGWETLEEGSCDANPHEIRFSEDHETLLLRFREPVEGPDGEPTLTARYRILSASPRLRLLLEGETRTTSTGESVVSEIVPLSHDRYCWRQEDWPPEACTSHIVRCR